MAGKSYTMREMKAIVEYLTEHKAYPELKGRKMWMEFANSQKTTRTWQSLKETFIKRILPDIHNPYYKLSVDQIRSFQQGCDVLKKERHNRLDLQPTSEDSSNDSKVEHTKETTSKNGATEASTKKRNENDAIIIDLDDEVEKVTGEVTSAKISRRSRSSEDTVVLENCYQNAEELQRDLESPHVKEGKTFKDLITFEPMTPAVRSVLEDFGTESESSDKESALKIDEGNTIETDKDSEYNPIENTPTEQAVDNQNQDTVEPNEGNKDLNNKTTAEEISANEDKNDDVQEPNPQLYDVEAIQNGDANEKTDTVQQVSDVTSTNQNASDIVPADKDVETVEKTAEIPKEKNRTSENSIQISGNTTSDTFIPNNQEGLDGAKKTQVEKHDAKKITKIKNRKGQKRSSKDSLSDRDTKKQKLPQKPESEIVIETVVLSDTPMVEENATEKRKFTESKLDNGPINKNSTTKTNHIFDALLESNLKDAINNDLKGTEDKSKENLTSQDINPCLQSVSLFDEQFKITQYSDSDSDDEATSAPTLYLGVDKPENKGPSPKKLKSNLKEGNSKDAVAAKHAVRNKNKIVMENKLQREKALANIFGFANGGASTNRKRKLSHKRSSQHRLRLSKQESNSSEWTSESDGEDYVSPPYGRRNKMTRKILKPKSSRVVQDPEQGGLYVMFGRKVYPLVKCGKHVKNFVTYTPDSDSELGDEYWKQKYLEERKKVVHISKLMRDTQEAESLQAVHPNTPPQSPPTKKAATTHSPPKAVEMSRSPDQPVPRLEAKEPKEKLVLKVATKNGARIHMEGAWTQISTAMPQLMQLLQNEPDCPSSSVQTVDKVQTIEKGDKTAKDNCEKVEISSGASTPVVNSNVDTDVHEKVNRLEKEIFKEIKEKAEEEQSVENERTSSNVTRRRGRPRVSSSSSSIILNPRKIQKTNNRDTTDTKQDTTENYTKNIKKQAAKKEIKARASPLASSSKQSVKDSKQSETDSKQTETNSTKSERLAKRSETPKNRETLTKQSDNVSPAKLEVPIQTRRQSLRLSRAREASVSSSNNDHVATDKPVRRVLTPRKSETESSNEIQTRARRSATKEKADVLDLDFDEENVRFKFPTPPKNKSKINTKKTLRPKELNSPIKQNINTESTYGYQDSDFSPIRIDLSKRKRRLSLNTRSRYKNKRTSRRFSQPPSLIPGFISLDSNNSSYFMPLKRTQTTLNSSVYRSDSIRILLPKRNQPVKIIENTGVLDKPLRYFDMSEKQSNETSIVGESSSISLPLSPELSVVEGLSISRDLIHNADHPTLNEMMSEGSKMNFNEYTMKGVDVSMPLMNQLCELKQTKKAKTSAKPNRDTTDLTLSESLDQRLRNLLLESTKKTKTAEENAMDIDISNLVTEKKKGKKRCSTPRRKKNIGHAKAPIHAIIEEHTETCSMSGRKSCPPAISFKTMDENATNCNDIVLKKKAAPRRKKDIIKVKIRRPKSKRSRKPSTLTDSGIIDAEVSGPFCKGSEDSVEINHNHTETCMKFNECVNDSVEFMGNMESVISVTSSVQSELDLETLLDDTAWYPSELTEHAQQIADIDQKQSEEQLVSPESVYCTPSAVNCSLITEDLSNSPQKVTSNWHLFSEDENTKTQPPIYSNLNKIFPVMCAVPDLSTITEASKDNENSRKMSEYNIQSEDI